MWRKDRSWVENFLSSWVVLMLGVLAVTSLVLRYVTEPVQCNMPAHFGSLEGITRETCFQQERVLLKSEEFLEYLQQIQRGTPSGAGGRSGANAVNPYKTWPKQHTYHQWVPFALSVAAILCLAPYVIGRVLGGLLGVDAHALVETISDNQRQNAGGRHVMLGDTALVLQAGLRGSHGSLTAAALVRKALACVVCLVHVVVIAVLFGPQLGARTAEERNVTSSAGASSASNVSVPEWLEDAPLPTGPFFCMLEFVTLQNTQEWTVECLLPLNKVFTKGFTFLFYFFLFLFLTTVLDLLCWAGRLFIPFVRDVTLIRNLSIINQSQSESEHHSSGPAHFYQSLGVDGRFLLAVTGDRCGPLAAADLTNHLWIAFKGGLSPTPAPKMFGPAPTTCAGSAPEDQFHVGYFASDDDAANAHTDKSGAEEIDMRPMIGVKM